MLPAGLCRGFVLAGGQSSRMGRDKALMEWNGRLLVLHVAEAVAQAAHSATLVGSRERYAFLGLPVVEDVWPGRGPLSGIHAALKNTDSPLNLVVGCDMPFLSAAFLERLLEVAASSGAQVTVPESPEFGLQALCAVFSRDALPAVQQALTDGEGKLSRVYERLSARLLSTEEWGPYDEQGLLFQNLNTPEDWERARRQQSTTCAER